MFFVKMIDPSRRSSYRTSITKANWATISTSTMVKWYIWDHCCYHLIGICALITRIIYSCDSKIIGLPSFKSAVRLTISSRFTLLVCWIWWCWSIDIIMTEIGLIIWIPRCGMNPATLLYSLTNKCIITKNSSVECSGYFYAYYINHIIFESKEYNKEESLWNKANSCSVWHW